MLRLQITSLLAKIESTYGTDPAPTGAANAILLTGKPALTPIEAVNVQRGIIRPYFGNADVLPSSIYAKLDFEVEIAGSGTAGVAPAWGPLMRACGLSETITAAAITGTGQAGSTTTSMVLAAGASAVDDFYDGMPISITAGTGNGQTGVIVDYNGTTKTATLASAWALATDATSQYSIGANVAYRPISQNFESVSMYFNIDGVLHKMTGVRGNVSVNTAVDQIPTFKFSMAGLFNTVADSASPTAVFTGWTKPLPVNKLNTPLLTLQGFATAALESMSIDMANAVTHYSLVGGTEQIIVTDRKPKGQISMEAVNVGTKDWWTAAKNALLGPFAMQHGTVAGNKVQFTAPAMQIEAPKYGDKNNIAMLQAGLVPTPVSGNDEIAIVTF